ncbi:PREDICTED: uncharacterized protein LOC104767386 [Camelina sativa]|uniref:Uncharacterized protein LOC104767386 n=1 Tax=Camelina sativa TaxID=90675 RepID=A0ABM0XR97_CAMSA|nr:PREDICTED: uncharacterized protein LOC104767386 [Camelina sativa]
MAKTFSLKLLIDEKINKVVLAEADQDFVDVLISLLTLPMGKIASLLKNHTTVLGCFKNLNKSVADMAIDHFNTEACKSMLLYPKSTKEIHCRRLKLNLNDTDDATRFYMCPEFFTARSCTKEYRNFSTSRCSCGERMSREIHIPEADQVGEVIGDNADGVFVSCRSSFIVTDDLKVSLNSIGDIMKVLKDSGYLCFSDLRETLLDVGFEEVLTLLGCLFTSETPLTCAFLKKQCLPKMQKMLSPPVPKTDSVEPCRVFSVKVFVKKFDRVILYAECNEDFIESLLTFLILPLELACSLSNNNTILGCVGNLCRSPCRRASASNFCQIPDYYACINNNNLFGYVCYSSLTYECLVPPSVLSSYSFARYFRRPLLPRSFKLVSVCPVNPKVKSGSSPIYETGFMKKNTKFIVSNDLTITPMNSSSTIGLLKKMEVDFSDLEEHQISISKAELINILRASLISSSALTNGLSSLLLKKPKEET